MGNLIHIETTLGALVKNRIEFEQEKNLSSVRFGPDLPNICVTRGQNKTGFCWRCVDGGSVIDRLAYERQTDCGGK